MDLWAVREGDTLISSLGMRWRVIEVGKDSIRIEPVGGGAATSVHSLDGFKVVASDAGGGW